MIIGHGIDLAEVDKIQQMLDKWGDTFLRRVYTDAELEQARRKKKSFAQSLAGRFAAKEAVMKTLKTGWGRGIAWRDIEILNMPSGEPRVTLHGTTKHVAEELGICEIIISISDTAQYAMASAIGQGAEKSK